MFTDIEGSTVRWDRNPGAMQIAVRRHDTLMRAAIEDANGVVFKTIGDAFCAVFWSAQSAVDAVLSAQRALAAEDFTAVDGVRVRMALHCGAAEERDNDYFGPTLNRVARLLAIGHGGQVLLSGVAAEAAEPILPAETGLRDMGEHRLKDLTAAEHVFQLTAPDLRLDFPRLNSLSVHNNNLPQQLTSFVGREQDVAEIQALIERHRLVSLIGTGGIGKTRCSLQVGAEMLESFHDGVWFADLAPLHDAALVPNVIGSIFGVQESTTRPMIETLIHHLRTKKLLLILDNCEHVIKTASQTAAALVRACPNVKIVATTRESLNVAGEVVHRLPTLAVPKATRHLTAHAALDCGAVALFEGRARAANSRFSVTDENAPTVAEICRRLDGTPLAIELAAARLKVMSVTELAKRLDERFRLLTGGDRTALPRQQTMRALIDWSYDGLSHDERIVFRSLAIFAGGFTLQGASTVCARDAIDEFAVIDVLTSLVDKSLVSMDPHGDDARYRLLESTRAYAREKLIQHDELGAIACRHACAYADVAEQHEIDYDTTPSPAWHAQVEFDLENVRAALAWSFDGGELAAGLRLAATLGRILLSFATAEARRWVQTALGRIDETTPQLIVARLKLADALLASVLNQFKAALAAAEEALALFGELDDRRGVADAQRFAGRSLIRMGRVADGEALLRAALTTYTKLGVQRLGGILRDLAVARSLDEDMAGARDQFSRALTVFRQGADEENVAITAAALAEAEFACGDPEAALSLAEEALQAVRGFGRDRMVAALLGNIAAYLIALECYDLASAHAKAALELAAEVDAHALVTFALQHLAAVAVLRPPPDDDRARDDPQLAATLIGFVDARMTTLDVVREYTEQHEYEEILQALHRRFSDETLAELVNEGGSATIDRAINLVSHV